MLNEENVRAACRHGRLDDRVIIPVTAALAGVRSTVSGAAVNQTGQPFGERSGVDFVATPA